MSIQDLTACIAPGTSEYLSELFEITLDGNASGLSSREKALLINAAKLVLGMLENG